MMSSEMKCFIVLLLQAEKAKYKAESQFQAISQTAETEVSNHTFFV